MLRLLNICVIAALVVAAVYVYRIKFESTRQAERVAKLQADIRRERDTIARLRAQWAKLETPARIQGLTHRHLELNLIDARQYDRLDSLPERQPNLVPPGSPDPIGALLESPAINDLATGTIPPARRAR